jgi:hypothetical protein
MAGGVARPLATWLETRYTLASAGPFGLAGPSPHEKLSCAAREETQSNFVAYESAKEGTGFIAKETRMKKSGTAKVPFQPVQKRYKSTIVGLVIILIAAAYSIFELPYHYPLRYPTDSVSYAMGFNNRVAVIACGVTLVLLSLWILRSGLRVEQAGALFQTSGHTGRSTPMGKTVFWTMTLIFTALTILLYLSIPIFGAYGEARYFFRRFDMVLQYGLVPYRQIEFAYGPALVYLPLAIIKIGQMFGIGGVTGVMNEVSYLIFYLFLMILGMWLLFYVVDHFRCKAQYRGIVYVLLGMSFFNVTFGLQYTATRYLLPFAALLWLHSAVRRESRLLAGPLRAALVGFLLPAAVFSISPEMGIAYLAAQTLHLLISSVQSKRYLAWGALSGVLVLPVFLTVFSMEYLACMETFSKGANNFPILPAAYIVLFLATLFYALPVLGVSLLRKEGRDALPIMAGWGALVLLMLPSTLGRCDPGHVFSSGIGAILLTFALLARYRPRGFTVYAILFLVVMVVMRNISDMYLYRTQLGQVQFTLCERFYSSQTFGKPPSSLVNVKDYDPFMIPFVLDYPTERYLRVERRIIPEYYPDLINVLDPSTAARKIRDLEQTKAVLVGKWVMNFKDIDLLDARTELPPDFVREHEGSQRHSLSMLFLYPVHYEMKNRRFNAYWAVARYLATHFYPVGNWQEVQDQDKAGDGDKGYVFMLRNGYKVSDAVKATSRP